jgi:glycosyltransferase involved in cell wall biosynthesis
MTKFSVLLPTRNGGPFLRDCIGSVLSQREEDLELVVADNANTDETATVLEEHGGDRRLKVVRHASVKSVTDNWMSALEASDGEYLVMIGDDDCLLPGYFEDARRLLSRYESPDCLVYNGYSFVFPGAVGSGTSSQYADPHFRFDRNLAEGELSLAYRRALLTDMFRFVVRYPLNIQLTMFSRRAVSLIPEPFFRPPFPDHFAINSMLLKAGTVVYAPHKLAVIGVSPKSFGHFVYGGDHTEGMTYLGSSSKFEGKLEGNELLNSMYEWLELLKRAYPADLGEIDVDRAAYVRRQAASWLLQYRLGALRPVGLWRRAAQLSPGDWGRLAGIAVDPAAWQRVSRLVAFMRRDRARSQLPGLKPLPGVSNISEFVQWLGARDLRPASVQPGA